MPTATLEDLARVPENGKVELVNGQVVRLPLDAFLPGFAAGEIKSRLRDYGQHTRSGYALGGTLVFVVDLPNRKSFSPDVAFFTGKPTGMRFLEGAPVFAVEVRSEGDYGPAAEAEISAKRADYFAASTLVVWDVDL